MPAPKPGARTTGAQPAGDKVSAAYQDLLQEIVEKKKQAAVVRKLPKKKGKGGLVRAVLAVLLPPIVAAVWIFKPFAPPPIEPVRPSDDAGAWQTALLGAARQVVAWRDSVGALPDSLLEVGVVLPGASYQATGDSSFSIRSYAEDRTVSVFVDGHIFGMNGPPVTAPPPAPAVFQ